MCGRFSLTTQEKLIEDLFGIEIDRAMYIPRYNCAPTQMLAVISNREPSLLSYYRWGLIPFWAKDISIGNKLINARAETITEKPSFRNCFQKRRCLVLSDGFYEWKKLANKQKQPYRIVLKSGKPFAMAGIWDEWKTPGNEVLRSFSIITTGPNELMEDIHMRMPVILHHENYKEWLTGTSTGELQSMLNPYPADEMKAYEVSKLINSPMNDVPEIIAEV